jgi:phosphoglycolate phosphatase-like HAD superfamily hydrolase
MTRASAKARAFEKRFRVRHGCSGTTGEPRAFIYLPKGVRDMTGLVGNEQFMKEANAVLDFLLNDYNHDEIVMLGDSSSDMVTDVMDEIDDMERKLIEAVGYGR